MHTDHRFGALAILCVLMTALSGADIAITAPTSGASVAGVTTFRCQTTSLPTVASVEYRLNGKALYDSGDPVGPVTAQPFAYTWHSGNQWDGPQMVQAIARDASGAVVATSAPVAFRISNGTAATTLIAPDATTPQHGVITARVGTTVTTTADETLIWMFAIDGVEQPPVFTADRTGTCAIDTTSLPDGVHELMCCVAVDSTPRKTAGMVQTPFTTANGHAAMELRANYSLLVLVPGEGVDLIARLAFTDGAVEPTTATFASDTPTVASVAADGHVVARSVGATTIQISAAGRTRAVRVRVDAAHIAPHFAADGTVLNAYDPARSRFLRSVFWSDGSRFDGDPGFGAALRLAGVTAFESGLYFNPADNPSDFATWKASMDEHLGEIARASAASGLSVFLAGDDLCRTAPELNDSIQPGSAERVRYAISWARDTANVIGIDMVDEVDFMWGDTPNPSDHRWSTQTPPIPDNSFSTLRGVIDSVAGRRPISWPVSGMASDAAVTNWQGRDWSAFSTIYWTTLTSFSPAYPQTLSLPQEMSNLDDTAWRRLGLVQRDKPVLLLGSMMGPMYVKRAAGDHFQGGIDEMQAQGDEPESVSASIMYAVAAGLAGIRCYACDSDQQKNERATSSLGAGELETGADPYHIGSPRWRAMSAAFNLIGDLEPYLLQPPTHAPDLGARFVTGAKRGSASHALIVVHTREATDEVTVDLSPYAFPGSAITRYDLRNDQRSSVGVSGPTDVVAFGPGQTAVWIFTSGGTGTTTGSGTTTGGSTTGGTTTTGGSSTGGTTTTGGSSTGGTTSTGGSVTAGTGGGHSGGGHSGCGLGGGAAVALALCFGLIGRRRSG